MLEVKTYKNWKEVCVAMNWKEVRGNTKKKYLKELNSLCEYIKEGNKYIITNIYNKPKEIEDKRKNRESTLDYSQFKVEKEIERDSGVYMIKLNNFIYIGETVDFKRRFRQHKMDYGRLMPYTKKLIEEGGEFYVLHNTNGIIDEILLKMLEYEYIKYFRENTDYIVINERKSINIEEYYNIKPPKPINEQKNEKAKTPIKKKVVKNKKKLIKKKIYVSSEDYEFAIAVLEHNGIEIIE